MQPGSVDARDLDLGVGKRGSFRAVLWIDGQEGSEEEVLFGVVPRPQVAGADPGSSMGIHSNFLDFTYGALKKLGVKWDRAMSPGCLLPVERRRAAGRQPDLARLPDRPRQQPRGFR